MRSCISNENDIDPKTRDFYRKAMALADSMHIPFLVGGAFAFNCYTGINRRTKDFDLFVHPRDVQRIMEAFSSVGYRTEITAPHWLGKAFDGEDFIDIIFGSGKGINDIDDEWFDFAVPEVILGMEVKLCPPEEIVWSKSYLMERERYDGADVAHLLLACGESLDWERLLRRFNDHWPVLYSHLVLFMFIYPSEKKRIPEWVMRELAGRLEKELALPPVEEKLCRGTLLSKTQYLYDVEQKGFRDARPVTYDIREESRRLSAKEEASPMPAQ
ncbi:MAG: nucleotidyltransferase family protein [Alphaproteobacteria bacterium]|uniref:Nucleotidyltransferase family protein n=1 Tax=Candidatus Nitrobium versatile TaxID=2884831 RepID=A0A953JDF4_9BACT|nr:nucleotidyltransferase family protein [Candidatus Nitrobium versatile]